MARLLFKNATIINEGLCFHGGIFVNDGLIADVFDYDVVSDSARQTSMEGSADEIYDLDWRCLAPGVIDTHVHFREPGAEHKGCMATESAAAVAGGVTSFLDMPNNNPPAVSAEALHAKMDIAACDSLANYGFYLGANDNNIDEVAAADAAGACAVKVFMGASTGGLMVNSDAVLRHVFERSPLLIATHCEDNTIIAANLARIKAQYGEDIPIPMHPAIRTSAACLTSTAKAVSLALETGARLHVLHVSTEAEVEFLSKVMARTDRISTETCVQYLCFDDNDYERLGAQIKCNPAIKSAADRSVLCDAVRAGIIKTISTDHAPHLLSEKQGGCLKAASGIPLVQYSLLMMLDKVREGVFTLPMVVEKMCHAPARLFCIEKRGFIRKGYYADLVVFDTASPSEMPPLSRCGWSPVTRFASSVIYTFVNGTLAARRGIPCAGAQRGMRLTFNNR
ncbi:MAG: dihydroorotase [Bacteroidales bacterium]|nr:dihydroorotase [Bacteroidales bacterium]